MRSSGVAGSVALRPASREDCRLLWELRNDPETRAASFKTDPIPFEEHQRWFEAAFDSAEIRIFVVQDPSGKGIGYVRFHLEGETAEVSVSVEPSARGKGYGTAAVRMAADRMLSENGNLQVVAYIKPANQVSARTFLLAGFAEEGRVTVHNTQVLRMLYGGVRPWIFRVDANSRVGLGHLRRSLSLAQALSRQGFPVRFATFENPVSLELIRNASFEAEPLSGSPAWSDRDLRWTLELARRSGAAGLLVDSEEAGTDYLAGLRRAGFLTAVRDDLGQRSLPVDLVINGNADAEQLPYLRRSGTRTLLGPSFAVLAPDFWEPPARGASAKEKLNLLLLAGGADLPGFLPDFTRRLGRLDGFQLTVVAGPFLRNRGEIEELCRSLPRPARFLQSPASLCSVMWQADLAVSAAGQALYDLACAGCPVFAFEAAPNQVGQLRVMEERGCVVRIESRGGFPGLEEAVLKLAADPACREEMARRGQALVDGKGAARVASEIATLCSMEKQLCHSKP